MKEFFSGAQSSWHLPFPPSQGSRLAAVGKAGGERGSIYLNAEEQTSDSLKKETETG